MCLKRTDADPFPVSQIGWLSGVQGQAVHLHSTTYRGEQALSAVHKQIGQGKAIHLLNGNRRTDSPLSRRTPSGVLSM